MYIIWDGYGGSSFYTEINQLGDRYVAYYAGCLRMKFRKCKYDRLFTEN